MRRLALLLFAVCMFGGCHPGLSRETLPAIPVTIITMKSEKRAIYSQGIPYRGLVIAAAHSGREIEKYENGAIYVGEKQLTIRDIVFAETDDWCIIKPSEPIEECFDVEWSRAPLWLDQFYIVTHLLEDFQSGDTDTPNVVKCRARWWRPFPPSKNETPPKNDDATTQPNRKYAEDKKTSCTNPRILFGPAQPLGKGCSGSPVLYYDCLAGSYKACGMLIWGNIPGQDPLCMGAIPFWKIGKEFREKCDILVGRNSGVGSAVRTVDPRKSL